jgi:SnoaL-like polyketide cyclase
MKHFVRNHFEDFVNKRNAAVIRKNMTADFYDHDGPGGKPTDLAGDEQMMVGMYKAMPDLHLTIEEMIAEGDKVREQLSAAQNYFFEVRPLDSS